jgi:hypothetical protein
MILIYIKKNTHRINYVFKHIFLRILGVEIEFTLSIEEFISHEGPKLSYGKKPLGNELFFQSHGLLDQLGIESVEIIVKQWEETKCFFSVGEKSALPFDIFAASFYLLSRYEEYLPHLKDANNRYPASESLGVKEQFIKSPVVDIWAYKLKDILKLNFPSLFFPERSLSIHNLVIAHEPFAYKYKGFFRSLSGYIGDLSKFKFKKLLDRTKVVLGLRPDPYQTFNWIIETIKGSTSELTVFFLLGESVRFREGINSQRKYFRRWIKIVADYTEVGLIFSKEAQSMFSNLKKEKIQMENIINRTLKSSLNDQFNIELPDNYRDLVELEVEKDYTMVYHDTVGFRSGTCTPYLFYDLDYEILTPLVIHCNVISTTSLYNSTPSEIRSVVDELYNAANVVNGTFSMIFSNSDFSDEPENEIWKEIFNEKLQQNAS